MDWDKASPAVRSYRPITKAELREFLEPYRLAFPGWNALGDRALYRDTWPVRQQIGFQVLRSAQYRPSCALSIIPVPSGQLLYQLLDVRHREVGRRDHARRWPEVLRAMETQFEPDVRAPLTLEGALRAAEAGVVGIERVHAGTAAGLALLNACLGNTAAGVHWCERVMLLPKSEGRDLYPWEPPIIAFATELRTALQTGETNGFLSDLKGSGS